MAVGRALHGLIAVCACVVGCGAADDGVVVEDTGFVVVSVVPVDESYEVPEAQVPELRFSGQIDPDVCDSRQLQLFATNDDGAVAFPVGYVLVATDSGSKVRFEHDEPLLKGYHYALVARVTDPPCTDTLGRPIHAFGSRFYVP